MTSIGKGICGWVTSLTASVALALVLLLGAAQPATAQPGQCLAYTAAEIDDAFTAWADATGFDPVIHGVRCEDDPGLPATELALSVPELPTLPNAFHVLLCEGCVSGPFNPDQWETFCQVSFPGGPFGRDCESTAFTSNLSIPERHICRAEILRSYTWRQLCAASAPASQN